MSRPPRAMILAAGFGTRLGELTDVRPKPMLPVCGAPLVRWSVLWLRSFGIREIVINLHHLGEQIEADLGDGSALGVSIAYSHEEGMILGTGGGLRHARSLLDDGEDVPVVVVNGKIMLELDLRQVLSFHAERGAEATMVLRPDEDIARWGQPLRVGSDGSLVALLGEERPGAPTAEPLMFTGVHLFQPRFFDRIPPEGEQCVIRTAYRPLFREGRGLAGFVSTGYWWEHSTIERYLGGVRNVLDGRVDLPYAEGFVQGIDPSAEVADDADVSGPVWVGPGARIGPRARVGPHVQLGPGAVVEADAHVSSAILWDGARAGGQVRDTVIPR